MYLYFFMLILYFVSIYKDRERESSWYTVNVQNMVVITIGIIIQKMNLLTSGKLSPAPDALQGAYLL